MSVAPGSRIPTILVGAGGALETALLPYHLTHFLAHRVVDVAVALTPAASTFVSAVAVRAITGNRVYQRNVSFRSSTPLHLDYAERDAVVLYPATARLIAQCALGVVSCGVSRVFAFAPKDRVLVVPVLHPRMTFALYRDHLKRLEDVGCTVLHSDSTPGQVGWRDCEAALTSRLHLEAKEPVSSWVQVSRQPREARLG